MSLRCAWGRHRPVDAPGLFDAVSVRPLQLEAEVPESGRYDWGPCVMRDGAIYRMWWVRLGGANRKRFPYSTVLPDGERFEFTYPDYGDRIYAALSRDGATWNVSGPDYAGPREAFGPRASGPLWFSDRPNPRRNETRRESVVIKVAGVFYMYYEARADECTRRATEERAVGTVSEPGCSSRRPSDGLSWKRPDDRDPHRSSRAERQQASRTQALRVPAADGVLSRRPVCDALHRFVHGPAILRAH